MKTHEIYSTLLINNTMKAIFTMFFSPETVVNSDDESGSSHESDCDPLTAPQDVCTIINPPTASISLTVVQQTLKKKRKEEETTRTKTWD